MNIVNFNRKKTAFISYPEFSLASVDNKTYEFHGAANDIIKKLNSIGFLDINNTSREVAETYDISLNESIKETSKLINELKKLNIIENNENLQKFENIQINQKNIENNTDVSHWNYAKLNLIPIRCKLNLTWRCNQKCSFCYNGDRENPVNSHLLCTKIQELSTEEIDDYLGQMKDAGTFFISLIGGEPLLRKDLDQILNITDKYQFAIDIITNGTLLTPQKVAMLKEHNIQQVFIPFFGSTSEMHNKFVKTENAFEKAVKGLKLLKEAGIRVGARSFITRNNFFQWEEVREMIYNMGADYLPSVQVHKSCDGKVDELSLRVTNEQLMELKNKGISMYDGHECLVGLARVDILPDASLAPCPLMVTPYGNLREKKFKDIWLNSPQVKRLRKLVQLRMDASDYGLEKASRCAHDAIWDDGGIIKLSSEAARLIKAFRETPRSNSSGC
ncbi:radical SAM/SPASM domain-containing protein [Silvanigrella aquatica]|uniref:Radical SAM core domain-containing protein n=1 Tax=Silvanigrella aquatica TaxID=1915309 RepID=A0A1L4CXT2_9BACT|nr:radical SAM protein [Silvanigrella aquatica]APJ02755.1 hypothetical protein AXG55_01970 [Silvanigrella aquatica]